MRALTFWCARAVSIGLGLLSLTACGQSPPPLVNIQVFQNWQLKPGDRIAGYAVTGGLGDISIDLRGQAIYAPFAGEVQRDARGCLFYSSAEVPAYLFRLCGVSDGPWWNGRPTVGPVKAGAQLGQATTLQFAALRRQSDGKWAIVEPDQTLIARLLKPPRS
jgi:hypothetical protein